MVFYHDLNQQVILDDLEEVTVNDITLSHGYCICDTELSPHDWKNLTKEKEEKNNKGIDFMKLFREKAGVLSPNPCWVFLDNGYLYINESLIKLLWTILTEWKSDKHLVG